MVKHKYDPKYVKYGFTYIDNKKGLKFKCVVRSEVFSQELNG